MGWLGELLLESVAPPSSYMPGRRAKLGMAGRILRGGSTVRQEVSSATMRDLGPVHPLAGGSRVVSADEVAAEVEEDLRTINPPVVQGWMAMLLGVALLVGLFGLGWALEVRSASDRILRGVVIALPVAGWLAIVALACAGLRELELDGDRIRLRRWLDHHLRRAGRDLGPAGSIRSRIEGASLALTSPDGVTTISMRGWPPSARTDAAEELPIWCGTDPGVRPSRRAQRDERRRAAIERHRADEAARARED